MIRDIFVYLRSVFGCEIESQITVVNFEKTTRYHKEDQRIKKEPEWILLEISE